MKLYLRGHEDRYALEQIQLALFPEEPMEPVTAPFEGDGAVSALHRGKVWLTATAEITWHGKHARAAGRMKAAEEDNPSRHRLLQNTYFKAASLLKDPPEWGSLSGVRPTKMTTRHLLQGGTAASARRLMEETYHVSPRRSRLCTECSLETVKAAKLLEPRDISVYVGIPFCPTRCAYCSFVSAGIQHAGKFVEPFLDCLCREIRHVGKLIGASGCRIRTLYIGGGTPTTLTTPQTERLMDTLSSSFDLTNLLEYTVEGGRPDTLDPEKLRAIRAHGCDRMSINPQTMVDSVLGACGRIHSASDIERAYRQAQNAGYKAINMDLIAGLPTDTFEGFRYSLDRIIGLAPENITVHTLAIKKGADLYENRKGLAPQEEVEHMVNYAGEALRAAGYIPYYLYKQKYMSGSFENVGWCRPGTECLYNIYMMEELHTIISVGGGGMNKVNMPDGTLKRFHNPKFPEQYIKMLDDVLRQKEELFALMKGSM